MKPAPFDYIRPHTIEEALQALVDHQDRDVKLLAGGQSLIPMMNFRVAQPDVLIDLGHISSLAGIEKRGEYLCIGSMTRHADVMVSEVVTRDAPLIGNAYNYVAHSTIRNRGTIGGSLAHADPASEMPCVMLAHDARFRLRSLEGDRLVPASEFFFAPFTTALEPTEILVEILLPCSSADERHGFQEVSLRKGDFAIAAVATRLRVRDGICSAAAVSVAGVAGTPVRASAAESLLIDQRLSEKVIKEAAAAVVDSIEFSNTATITAEYRRDLTQVLTQRALLNALQNGAG